MRISDWSSDVCSSDLTATAITSSAHTAGPWRVGESENPHVYGGQKHLVILSDPETTHGVVIADVETVPEAQANARRSEDRRGGKYGAMTCTSWWLADIYKTQKSDRTRSDQQQQ